MNSENASTWPLRILVVENHPDTLYWLKILLEDLGHEVFTARTVAEGVPKLEAESCQVLICDIGLGDGTGWDLLKAAQLTRPIYAIAVSGFGMSNDIERSRAAGFRAHLLKPFRAVDLEKLLTEAAAERIPCYPLTL